VFLFFWHFMPVAELDASLAESGRRGRLKWPGFKLDRDEFCRWLGLWFTISAEKLRPRKSYWDQTPPTRFGDIMPLSQFNKIQEIFQPLQYPSDHPDKMQEVGVGEDSFKWIRRWLHACNAAWRGAWEPGRVVTVDETMVCFEGMGVHLTAMDPRGRAVGAKQGRCVMCPHRTWNKCICGRPICGPTRRANSAGERAADRDCLEHHKRLAQAGVPEHSGPPPIRQGPRPGCLQR